MRTQKNAVRATRHAVGCAMTFAFAAAVTVTSWAETKTVSFNRDIRPIFSDTCFQCHGPDEAKRKSGVRFDQRESAVSKAKSGDLPIVPGKPEDSEVMKRLTSNDPDELMPPPKLNKKLTPQQIETVRRWIAEGAEYEGHWAFIK